MLHHLTSWKRRLMSAKCQDDVGKRRALPPSDLLSNKSLNLTIGYIGGSARINIHAYCLIFIMFTGL